MQQAPRSPTAERLMDEALLAADLRAWGITETDSIALAKKLPFLREIQVEELYELLSDIQTALGWIGLEKSDAGRVAFIMEKYDYWKSHELDGRDKSVYAFLASYSKPGRVGEYLNEHIHNRAEFDRCAVDIAETLERINKLLPEEI